MTSSMDNMTMQRSALIEALTINRAAHRERFLEAQQGYREVVIKELDQMLADARAGNKIKRSLSWPEPEDHTGEYDQALKMLEMCVDDAIAVSHHEFRTLVMDEWGWKAGWSDVTSNYVKRP